MKMITRTNQPVEGDEIENLEVTGKLKAFENIVDKDGHKRFIEASYDIEEVSGIEQVYCKWSLSGTHFMLVMACNIANGTTFANEYMAKISNIPTWIINKIYPIFAKVVMNISPTAYASDGTGQSLGSWSLYKQSDTELYIIKSGSTTLTADRTFRIQFDLLIDNE